MNTRQSWAGSILGRRKTQQDWCAQFWSEDEAQWLCVLADGMGGEISGDRASFLAGRQFCESFEALKELPVPDRLMASADSANRAIFEAIEAEQDLAGMGTTLVAIHYNRGQIFWLSIGDSRLYLFSGGEIRKLNADHSYGALLDRMVRQGRMTEAEALMDPDRHALISALDGGTVEMVEVTEQGLALGQGDVVIVASDGIDTLEIMSLPTRLAELPEFDARQIGKYLLESVSAADRPGQDNCTVAVLCIC